MTRESLEAACLSALDAGRDFIDVEFPGDPSSRRCRLLGHRLGPRGTVIDWRGQNIIGRFDASQVLAYIDTLPLDSELL